MNRKIIFLIIILFAANVSALGITPGRNTIDYKPGESKEVKFTIVNSDKTDLNLVIFVQGEFNNTVALSDVNIEMKASEESRAVSYTLNMPSGLSPGLHTSEVVVMQLPSKSAKDNTFVGATLAVVTQIHVNVPYPGKYAVAEVNIIGPSEDGKINFVIPVVNKGDLDLARVVGGVDIFTSLNEKVDSVTTNTIEIKSKERKEIVAEWDSSKVQSGPYRAVANIVYDEKSIKIEKEFNVGKKSLKVEDIAVNNFKLGEIAKFEMLVNNEWSETIEGAYIETFVYNNDGEVMAQFKSATYDLPALQKTLMVSFWDTQGVKEGTYNADLFVRYGQSSDQVPLKFEVSSDEINIVGFGYVIKGVSVEDSGKLTKILVGVIIVLILINLSWFMFLRKRFVKK